MKKAFTYLQLLTVLSLFLLFFTLTGPPFFKILRQTSQKTAQINIARQVNRALDTIQQDVLTAEKFSIKNNELHYTADNIDYIYLCNNNRLARKKLSYSYLTPKEINITGFNCQPAASGGYCLELLANKKLYRRKISCLN